MSSGLGYPDWQKIQQWIGAPIVSQVGLAIGAGTHDDGPVNLASWASVIVAIKPTGGAVTVTVKQQISGGPAGLELDTSFTVQAGVTVFESIVLSGDAISLHLQGGGVGTTVDYALIPSNTTINAATVSGGGVPTGTILTFAGAAPPAGYVRCDGAHYDGTQAVYAALWNLIGLTYGGTSQADFAVPDLQGRVPVGLGTNASVNARGLSDGVAVANRRPHHRHTPHSHGGATGTDSPDHVHGENVSPGGAAGNGIQAVGAGAGNVGALPTTNGASARHTHSITAGDGGSQVATDSLDAPAFLVVNYIIAL